MKKSRFPSPLEIPDPLALYTLARFTCNQIEQWAADLVLVCMPGGQGTLLAAQALWAETRSTPFPPVATIHLSEQHVAHYERLPHCPSGLRLVGLALDTFDAGAYLAWVDAQAVWLAELRAAVEATLGSGRAPTRIVTLGEAEVDEVTAILALGLLTAAYPAAQARYIFGHGDFFGTSLYWPIHFVEEWVNGPQKAVISRLPTNGEEWDSIGADLISLAQAGDTAGPETLDWQPITADHPIIERLSAYFPRADLVALPGWTANALRQVILGQHRAATRPRRRPRSGPKPARLRPYRLPAHFLIGRALWLRRRLTAAEAAQAAGVTVEAAAEILERELTPGLMEAEDADGVRTYCLRNRAAILAYGSLRADPRPELTSYVERRIPATTPFPVEYVRSSPTCADAPVLVPVPAGYGATAPAEVLVLAPEVDRELAAALLQQRELNRTGADDMWFAADEEETPVRELPGFAGLPVVLYAAGAPNLPEVIPDDIPLAARGEILARLAAASVTAETYTAGTDGIRYLADAVADGIETPLTPHYRAAVLALAGGAPDLETARARIARQRGIA